MSAGASIIGQCAECCTCPTATVEWDSRSASKTKADVGYSYDGSYYKTTSTTIDGTGCPGSNSYTSTSLSTFATGLTTYTGTITRSDGVSGSQNSDESWTITGPNPPVNAGNCASSGCVSECAAPGASVGVCWGTDCSGQTSTYSYTAEVLPNDIKDAAISGLPAWDNDWNDTAGSYADLSDDEFTFSIRESRYRLRFKIPEVNTGTCYRANWVERFTPEGGGAVADTPRNWQWSAGDSLANGRWFTREVADAGHALVSIEVIHGGTGFTTAPAVTISDGGGTGATATASVSGGAITGITLVTAGTGYKTNPTITLSYGGASNVLLAAHFGSETEYTGTSRPGYALPVGYVPTQQSTWGVAGDVGTSPWKYFELSVPAADGTTTVENLTVACRDCV